MDLEKFDLFLGIRRLVILSVYIDIFLFWVGGCGEEEVGRSGGYRRIFKREEGIVFLYLKF